MLPCASECASCCACPAPCAAACCSAKVLEVLIGVSDTVHVEGHAPLDPVLVHGELIHCKATQSDRDTHEAVCRWEEKRTGPVCTTGAGPAEVELARAVIVRRRRARLATLVNFVSCQVGRFLKTLDLCLRLVPPHCTWYVLDDEPYSARELFVTKKICLTAQWTLLSAGRARKSALTPAFTTLLQSLVMEVFTLVAVAHLADADCKQRPSQRGCAS